jgi:hypothetical protein
MITEKLKIENLLKSGISTLTMYRINHLGKRLYCTATPFKVYSGLTGALSSATFKGNIDAKRISKWRDKMIEHLGGQDTQEAYLDTMADFGTILHECLVKIKEKGKLNWKEEQDYAYAYFDASARAKGINPNEGVTRAQVFEYCKSAAALLQFFHDNVVEVYSIEGMAKSDKLQIATPIDITCLIKDKKKDFIATLNLKTSSQIGDHQREQCAVEKYLWNETYPDCQAVKTGILRPKDWNLKKGIPTYELEFINEEKEAEMLKDAISRLLLIKDNPSSTYLNYSSESLIFEGETLLGGKPSLTAKTIEQLFNETHETVE